MKGGEDHIGIGNRKQKKKEAGWVKYGVLNVCEERLTTAVVGIPEREGPGQQMAPVELFSGKIIEEEVAEEKKMTGKKKPPEKDQNKNGQEAEKNPTNGGRIADIGGF